MDKAASPTWFRALLRGSGFLPYDEPFNEALPPPSFVGVDRSSFIRHKSPAIRSFLLYSERGK